MQAVTLTISGSIPLAHGGNLTNGDIIGLAYDSASDALWVSDTDNHRVVRIFHPATPASRVIDMVLGQPDSSSTEANRSVDVASENTCSHVVADGFGNLGMLRLDHQRNLYIVDAIHEGWACSNNRVLEYDNADLTPDPTKDFFAQGERVPKRVYAKADFVSKTNGSTSSHLPNTPISISFKSDNSMLMTVDAYGNVQNERIYLYNDPVPTCESPCAVAPDDMGTLTTSQPSDSSWDSQDNLIVLDHTWNRVLYFSAPEAPTDTPTDTPIPTDTPTTTTTPVPTPTPTSTPEQTSSDTGSSSSEYHAPVCTDQAPGSTPNLYQLSASNTSVTVQFAPATDPYTKYEVSYGFTPDANMHTTEFPYSHSAGSITYTVNQLQPNTNWYFKVRAGNGCAWGLWSQILRAKTTSNTKTKATFYPKDVSNVRVPTPKGQQSVNSRRVSNTPKPSLTTPPANPTDTPPNVFSTVIPTTIITTPSENMLNFVPVPRPSTMSTFVSFLKKILPF
jgi:hypothetical protein